MPDTFSLHNPSDCEEWSYKQFRVKIKHLLGEGGYGKVYEARNKHGQQCAAKRVQFLRQASLERKPKLYERLVKFSNINVLNILDYASLSKENSYLGNGPEFWVFSEYCRHGDLDKFYKKHPSFFREDYQENEFKEVTNMMVQIAQGLDFLHDKTFTDIVHRDIKPKNIMVAEGKNPDEIVLKLGDFGLSKYFSPEDTTSGMQSNVGTHFYKAPEFFQPDENGKINYHRGCDIFSTGLTYLALFQASSASEAVSHLSPSIESSKENR